MKKLLFTLLLPVSLQAATMCVGPSASGSGTGADWNNKLAWSATPTRGDTWYLEDGAYTTKTFSVAASGTTAITIKKAIVSDHGTNTGWSDTMGDGQATFSGQFQFSSPYWVIDGQTGGGPGSWTSGFGFKITEITDALAVMRFGLNDSTTTAHNVIVRHVELVGKGSVSTDGGGASNDGIANYGSTNLLVSYFYMHGIGRCPFFLQPFDNIFEHGYTADFYGDASVHSELASMWQFNATKGTMGNVTFRYCVFTHTASTGGIMWDNNSNHAALMRVYGCVFYRPSADTWVAPNGVIGGWTGANSEDMYGMRIFHNAFVDVNVTIFPNFITRSGDNYATNNLFYNCTSPDFTEFAGHDFNHYINSGGTHSEANGTSAASGDPFTAYTSLDFTLTGNTTTGQNLGSPYNTDPVGNTRTTWTRGAYEYAGGDVTAPTCVISSPASVSSGSSGSYSTSSSTITVSGTSDDATATITWSNSRGGAGTATGSDSWSQSGITLFSGGNVLSFVATDGSANFTTTTLNVTYTVSASGGSTNNVGTLNIR